MRDRDEKGDDLNRFMEAGIHAMLVGEALLQAEDPGAKICELLGDLMKGSNDP